MAIKIVCNFEFLNSSNFKICNTTPNNKRESKLIVLCNSTSQILDLKASKEEHYFIFPRAKAQIFRAKKEIAFFPIFDCFRNSAGKLIA